MKQQILTLLIAKFAGVSEKILDRIATNMAKTATTEEQVATAVEGVTIQSVMDNQADYRANEATVSAVSNYENKHGLKDGQKKTTGGESQNTEPDPNGNNDNSTAMSNLLGVVKTLTEEVAAMKSDKVTDSRKQRFDAIIANLPEDQKNAYKRTAFDSLSDEEFETLATDVTTEVGAIEASEKARGSVFARPLGGGGAATGKPSAKDADAVANSIGL